MTTGTFERDDELSPARLSLVAPGPPGLGDPVLLGDVVALVISDLSVRRMIATEERGKELAGRVLHFAPSLKPRTE